MKIQMGKGHLVNIMGYIGDGVVLESNLLLDEDGTVTRGPELHPHYFNDKPEAVEFIIKNAYALLNMGWRVME